MYFELNDADGHYESTLGLLHDVLPPDLAAFLSPIGTDWDAPVEGDVIVMPPTPATALRAEPVSVSESHRERITFGSNNWAVAGVRTTHGGALLASDMHLGHAVPNIWYRAVLNTAVGVTLPGTPFLVAGSNTKVAWALTNSNGDWVDLVEIETHAQRRTWPSDRNAMRHNVVRRVCRPDRRTHG